MQDNFPRTHKLLASGGVRRWHTTRTMKQTTAEHSWGVALILSMYHPSPSVDLLRAALFHDCHEKLFGDIPSPIKQRWPEIKAAEEYAEVLFFHDLGLVSPYDNLSAADLLWLDWADKLEAYHFLCDQPDPDSYEMRCNIILMVDAAWDKIEQNKNIGKPWAEWKGKQ